MPPDLLPVAVPGAPPASAAFPSPSPASSAARRQPRCLTTVPRPRLRPLPSDWPEPATRRTSLEQSLGQTGPDRRVTQAPLNRPVQPRSRLVHLVTGWTKPVVRRIYPSLERDITIPCSCCV